MADGWTIKLKWDRSHERWQVIDPSGSVRVEGAAETLADRLADHMEQLESLREEVKAVLELMDKITMYSESDQGVFSSLRDRLRKAVG